MHYQFNYSVFDLNVSDLDRAGAWMQDFQWKDALEIVEPFHYMTLPNDHTGGNNLGLNATQQVAQNDAALDIVLRTLVKSKIWSQSIVFVIEDDAQSGLDHVDATRTTGPFADRVLQSTASISRPCQILCAASCEAANTENFGPQDEQR